MVAYSIRTTIRAALRQEHDTQQLRSRIAQQLPQLQDKLLLPEQDQVSALMAFITDYIESVPGCLRLVTAESKRLGFFDYAAPFLHLAEDYFLQAPDELPQHVGLESMMDKAFLALRLLEEVNDHHIRHLHRPLLPLEITEANIIVHHLLGDEFATRIEQLVQYTAAQLLHREYVWQEVRDRPLSRETASYLISPGKSSKSAPGIRLRLAS